MKFHELKVKPNRKANRVGRGISAGQGKTAGRGTKGQKSRTGSRAKPGFAGGTNPLMQQLPKLPGFKSHKTPHETVYTGQLEALGATVDNQTLAKARLVSNPYVSVKLLVKGDLKKKVAVKLQAASAGAVAALESAGGSFEKVARQQRPITSEKKAKKTEE
jgi:large subunit ribosomal protein L15